MTPAMVGEIYEELNQLSVPLIQSPELGLGYYRERLVECRQKQDRISEILVRINRELSVARGGARALRLSVEIAGRGKQAGALRTELEPFLDTEDTLKYLLAAARLRRENLRATSSDIRLMVNVIEQQLKLGEIQPPKTKHKEVDVPLPFTEPTELSMDSEWPEPAAKVNNRKRPTVIDDDVDVNNIF